MPGSPKRIRPDCPYSASQLNLIKLQDDRVALDLGILSHLDYARPWVEVHQALPASQERHAFRLLLFPDD